MLLGLTISKLLGLIVQRQLGLNDLEIKNLEINYLNYLAYHSSLNYQANCGFGEKNKTQSFQKGSGYFASRGKIAPCYFAIGRQNSPNGYFAISAKIALSLMLTPTLTLTQTLTLTLIPTLALTQTLTQTKEKHYFASRGKIATSFQKFFGGDIFLYLLNIFATAVPKLKQNISKIIV